VRKQILVGSTLLILSLRFRWVYCQLETLRHCLPSSVWHVLGELPETLDETYERILQEIPKSNRVHTHRLLQCLTVAVRPLGVEELAEVLAIDFDAAGGIPELNEDLRWEDQEQAVLFACSSLITIVGEGYSRVVQFSHFSVKEFLTSDRLATSMIDASRYHHIRLEQSHTIMAQACLSVLLCLSSLIHGDVHENSPLARYAAEHFGDHAESENVLAHIRGGVDDLLNADKPHFAAWLWVRGTIFWYAHPEGPGASPLYYVSEFGFRGIVEYLISKHPEDLNVEGLYGTPLHAALHEGHADVALLLLGHCSDINVRGIEHRTPLHMAVDLGLLEITRVLVERHADINARDSRGRTPLHPTMPGDSGTFDDRYFDVVQYLLEHGADVDAQANTDHSTPLHLASYWGGVKTAQLLLDHGANIDVRDEKGQTQLHRTLINMGYEFQDYNPDDMLFLLDYGADVDALDDDHSTPLHVASQFSNAKVARLLLEHGANIHVGNANDQTPLHIISSRSGNMPSNDSIHMLWLFLEHGADVDALDNNHSTPLHLALHSGSVEAARSLLEYGASIHVRDKQDQTPLQLLMADHWFKGPLDDYINVIRLFLEHGGDIDSTSSTDSTMLHVAVEKASLEVVHLLLDCGANINARDENGQTPLHRAMYNIRDDMEDHFFAILLFLDHGADVDALDNSHSTPLSMASYFGSIKATRLLLEYGASTHLQNVAGQTPLEVALMAGHEEVTQLLLEHL